MDGQVVNPREHLVDGFDVFDSKIAAPSAGNEWVETNATFIDAGPIGDHLSDAAQTDDAKRLSGEVIPMYFLRSQRPSIRP